MPFRVALIIETSTCYGRDLLSGVVRYMRIHENWSIFLDQQDLTNEPPAWLNQWNGDGIISRVSLPDVSNRLAQSGVPLVELTDRHDASVIPHVRSDDDAIGEMAAEHLLERGFRRFGFCGFSDEAWSNRRQAAFARKVAEAGCECSVYTSPWYGDLAPTWEQEQSAVIDWLKKLKPPFGMMGSNDLRGHRLLDACSYLGLSVPEEVAVVGVDNDALLCRMSMPPLSSVMVNAEAVGYRAAEILSKLMFGQAVDEATQLVPPIGVATRHSSDIVAIEDRGVAAALKYIRENACLGVGVDDVIQNTPLSRSTLERQFRKLLGRTPQQEIRQVQVKRVRELVSTTDLPLEQIAIQCGFENPEYMYVVFKRIVGMTPGNFRLQSKPSG